MNQDSFPTPLQDYITEMLPWAHGHQVKVITDYVAVIINKQTGIQAALARSFGNQEAACKRVGRLLHNERLKPNDLAEAVIHQALRQVLRSRRVRFTIDWTSEADQHLLVISLVVGRRALPIYWRAYRASVLKGRMRRYERAVIKRAYQIIVQYIDPNGIRLTADRGFADVELFELLEQLGIRFVIRVKSSTNVGWRGQWCSLGAVRFEGNSRHRSLGGCSTVKAHCIGFGSLSAVPVISRAAGRSGIWSQTMLAVLPGPVKNTVAVFAVKRVFAMPNGIWDSNKRGLRVSRPGRGCLPYLPSLSWC